MRPPSARRSAEGATRGSRLILEKYPRIPEIFFLSEQKIYGLHSASRIMACNKVPPRNSSRSGPWNVWRFESTGKLKQSRGGERANAGWRRARAGVQCRKGPPRSHQRLEPTWSGRIPGARRRDANACQRTPDAEREGAIARSPATHTIAPTANDRWILLACVPWVDEPAPPDSLPAFPSPTSPVGPNAGKWLPRLATFGAETINQTSTTGILLKHRYQLSRKQRLSRGPHRKTSATFFKHCFHRLIHHQSHIPFLPTNSDTCPRTFLPCTLDPWTAIHHSQRSVGYETMSFESEKLKLEIAELTQKLRWTPIRVVATTVGVILLFVGLAIERYSQLDQRNFRLALQVHESRIDEMVRTTAEISSLCEQSISLVRTHAQAKVFVGPMLNTLEHYLLRFADSSSISERAHIDQTLKALRKYMKVILSDDTDHWTEAIKLQALWEQGESHPDPNFALHFGTDIETKWKDVASNTWNAINEAFAFYGTNGDINPVESCVELVSQMKTKIFQERQQFCEAHYQWIQNSRCAP